jgi:hypothetical protein
VQWIEARNARNPDDGDPVLLTLLLIVQLFAESSVGKGIYWPKAWSAL